MDQGYGSVVRLRTRRQMAGALLGLLLLGNPLLTGALRAEDPPPEESLSRRESQLLEGLARGENVAPEAARLAAERGGGKGPLLPPRSRTAARLGAAFEELARSVEGPAEPRDLARAFEAFEAFEALDLLLRRELEAARATLERLGIDGEIADRRAAAERRYLEASDRLHRTLGVALRGWRRAGDGHGEGSRGKGAVQAAGRVEARSAVARAAREVRDLLDLQRPREPVSLLRAAPLPYRRSELPPRDPRVLPAIRPSYQDPLAAEPGPEDLGPTPEAPLSEAILTQAEALGYDAVAIFEFVRNSITPELYAGGMKGAEGTLSQRSGNDVDQASLLIALLRASRVPARYVRGVAEVPVEQLAAELGLADPRNVPAVLGRAGLAFRPVVRGGRVAAVELELTWVSAFVPYTNYRGAVVDFSGRTWVPLAPAVKSTALVPPRGVLARMGFSAAGFETGYLGTVQQTSPLAEIRRRVEDYLLREAPGESYEDQLGRRTVVAQALGLLPSSLPLDPLVVTEESAALAPEEVTRVRVVARSGAGASSPAALEVELPLSGLAGRRVTLSYTPATVEDHRTVNAYGGLYAVPAYLVRLRPQLKVDGRPVAVGEGVVDMGVAHRLEVRLTGPWGTETVSQQVLSGSYHALALAAQRAPASVEDRSEPGDTEQTGARILAQIAHRYAAAWDAGERELGGLAGVEVLRPLPSLAVASLSLAVDELLGLPFAVDFEGVTLDAALRVAEPVHRTGDAAAARDWMRLATLHGSALEHLVFREQLQVEGLSADKGLGRARDLGIQVLRLDAANLPAELPNLAHPQRVKDDVANWVRLGLTVEIPRGPVTLNAWKGSVWRALEASTGAGGYFIAGGLAGGATSEPPEDWVLDFLARALASPYSAEPNTDPLAAVELIKVPASDGQEGEVGEVFRLPLAVLARDAEGRPVAGAEVVFQGVRGNGTLVADDGTEGGTLVVATDALGIARVRLRAGTETSANPRYVLRHGADRFTTQALMHFVEAAAAGAAGPLVVREPFSALAYPGEAVALRRTDIPRDLGLAGTWADTAQVSVEDSYGNPVSNVPVTFAVDPASQFCEPPAPNLIDGAVFDNTLREDGGLAGCPVLNPVLGECGEASLVQQSSRLGAFAGLILGNANQTIYRFSVSAPALSPLSFEIVALGSCSEGPQVRLATSSIVNNQGESINAARPGQVSRVPVSVTVFYSQPDFEVLLDDQSRCFLDVKPSLTWVRTTANLAFTVGNGGSTGPVSRLGDGSYQASVRTGLTPGANEIHLEAADIPLLRSTVDPVSCRILMEESFENRSTELAPVYGLEPSVLGVDPDPVLLTDEGLAASPVSIRYRLDPASYPGTSAQVDVFEEGELLGVVVGDRSSGDGTALISRGVRFDIEKSYQAEVVANRGSVLEVRGDRFDLPFFQRLFTRVSGSILLQQEVDVINRRWCASGSEFSYSTTQEARITLTFRRIEGRDPDGEPHLGSSRVLIDDQLVAAGHHSLSVAPSELTPGEYLFTLEGTSTVDGHSEVRQGFALSQFKSRNALPVGHTMVKGVDLFDGHLVLSRQDLAVPGRGVSLELLRSYSSSGGGEPGPFGVGWGHGYDSKLILTPCGEAIVVGSAGSGMTFVADGQGGYRPLKGHHGTLRADPRDGSFDFYSIDGTRYHYFPRRSGEWGLDFIEDVNGNTTDLAYDTTGAEPRLVSVTAPGGRSLTFTYQRRSFRGLGDAEVIVRVDGPAGLSMEYGYDDEGNLTRARREGGILHETYQYPELTATNFDRRHLLERVTDEVRGSSTLYTFEEAVIGIQGDLQVPAFVVSSLTEPEGGLTRFEYDRAALADRGPPTLTQRVIDRRGRPTTYVLNQYGSPLSVRDPLEHTVEMSWSPEDVLVTEQTDANGSTTTFDHDADGNLLRQAVTVTDVDGVARELTIVHTYRPASSFSRPGIKNRAATTTDRRGVTTTFTYDGRGNLLRREILGTGFVETHTYDARGDRRSTTDPLGRTTTFTYDAAGNLLSITDPLGGVSSTVWDARGRAVEQRNARGFVTRSEYDGLNRVVRTTYPDQAVERTVFDDGARTATFTDALERTTVTRYDREGRPLQVTDPEGGIRVYGYDREGNKTLESNWFDDRTPRSDTTFSYDAAGRLTTRTEPEGRVTAYAYDPDGNLLREVLSGPGLAEPRVTEYAYDELSRRHTVRRFDGSEGVEETRKLDGEGNVLEEKDPLGHRTVNAFDGVGRLTSTTDPAENTTSFAYDAAGNRLSETDALGRVRSRAYDALGRVIRRTDALGNVTLYEYDAVGNLVREIDPRLHAVEHVYDARDRRIRTRQQVSLGLTPPGLVETVFSYDAAGNLTGTEEANGNTVVLVYDGLDRLSRQTDDLGPVLERSYDAGGNLVREVDARGHESTFEYDRLGRLVLGNLPGGRTVSSTYDAAGNRLSATDPNGDTTRFEYDDLDRLVKVVDPPSLGTSLAFRYDLAGNLVRETDRRGQATLYQRDELGRVQQVRYPLGLSESLSYDAAGNVVTYTDRRGIATELSYDRENRILAVSRAGVTLQELEYDAAGNVRFDRDANGNTVGFEYDERNLPIAENRPLAAITRFGLDAMGDQVRERDPEGRVRQWSYDARRRVVSRTDGSGAVTRFGWDGNSNLARVEKPEGGVWRWEYDPADRLERALDPEGGATAYGYDLKGNRTSVLDPRSHRNELEYDALGRLTALVYPDGARLERDYDGEGNVLEARDPKGQVITFLYDELGRQVAAMPSAAIPSTGDDLTHQTAAYDGNGNLTSVTEVYGGGSGTRTTTYAYDDFDRLERATDPAGKTLTYAYDGNGNRSRLTDPDGRRTTYGYDALNRLVWVTLPQAGVTNYRYLRNGRLQSISYPNGSASTLSYDGAHRITRVENRQGAVAVSTFDYLYDRNGNRIEQRELNGGTAETTTYAFDLADRLLRVSYPEATAEYTYDAAGNRRTEQRRDPGGSLLSDRIYGYDLRNRLLSAEDLLDPAGSVAYGYDANGNQISRAQGGSLTTFVYDVRDRVAEVSRDGVLQGRYLYDHQGLRVRKATASGILRYVYDDGSVLLETDDAGNTVARYEYGPDRLLSLDHAGEGRQYYLFDALRSVTNLVRPDGGVQARYKYDAWGGSRSTTGASFNPFGFTGHERDAETGLYYMKARFYDPEVGRFLTEDPVVGNVLNPPSLHRYLYAYNNPTVNVDPDGRIVETVWDIASIGLGVTSLAINVQEGNWGSAALDAFGVVVDTAAAIVPFVPGGVGVALKAGRLAKKAGDAAELARATERAEKVIDVLQLADTAANGISSAADAAESFQQGRHGWGTFNAAMAGLGARQAARANVHLKGPDTPPARDAGSVNKAAPDSAPEIKQKAVITGEAPKGGADGDLAVRTKSAMAASSIDLPTKAPSDAPAVPRAAAGGAGPGGTLGGGSPGPNGSRNLGGGGGPDGGGPGKPPGAPRKQIIADNNVLAAASNPRDSRNAAALRELTSADDIFITVNQLNEFTRFRGISRSQRHARQQFLRDQGIKVLDGKKLAADPNFQSTFKKIVAVQGRGDAVLIAASHAAGIEAVTFEKRLRNFLEFTLRDPTIPLPRRLSPK